GKAAYAYGNNADFDYVAYRHIGKYWSLLDFKQYGDYFEPLAYAPDHQHIYVTVNKGGGPGRLVEEKLDGSDRKTLASDDFSSVGDIQWTAPPARPFAVMPAAGKPEPIFINPKLTDAKLYR